MEFSSRVCTVQGQESIVSEAVLLPLTLVCQTLWLLNHMIKGKQKPFNIADFKSELAEGLVWLRLKDSLEGGKKKEHQIIPYQFGECQRSGYCAVTDQNGRTCFLCEVGEVLHSSIGSGTMERDCIALGHKTKNNRQSCLMKYKAGQVRTRKEFLKSANEAYFYFG